MNLLKKISLIGILLIILVANGFRLYKLEDVPFGFHVDEMSSAVTIQCLATEGVDAYGNKYPVFSQDYGSYKPPTYIYPGVLWTKIFGYSIASFRGFTAFIFILGLPGLFLLCRRLISARFGLIAVLLASVSPWLWIHSRIGYEATMSLAYLFWGLYFFFKKDRVWNALISGMFLSLALYSYTPMRAEIPLLLLTLIVFRLKFWKPIRVVFIIWVLAALAFTALPLVHQMFFGGIQQRFANINIFNGDYLASIGKTTSLTSVAGVFINNYLMHFDFQFLFITGDKVISNSIKHFGELGWLDILGVFAAIFLFAASFTPFKPAPVSKEHRYLLIFLVINIAIGLIPDSLTQLESANSLRSICAWPFVEIFIAYFLWRWSMAWKGGLPAILLTGTVFSIALITTYFGPYVKESTGFYSPWAKQMAINAKTEKDWLSFLYFFRHNDFHARYYMMNYHGDSCSGSKQKWESLRDYLIQNGQYQ